MNTKRTVEEVRNKTVFSPMKGCNVGLWFSGRHVAVTRYLGTL